MDTSLLIVGGVALYAGYCFYNAPAEETPKRHTDLKSMGHNPDQLLQRQTRLHGVILKSSGIARAKAAKHLMTRYSNNTLYLPAH